MSHVEANARELERLRALVAGVSDEDLSALVYERWTVADVLGHMAFWDANVIALARRLERGEGFGPSDAEPEDVRWINDAARTLIHATAPREAARLAVRLAEEADGLVAKLPAEQMWPQDPTSPINGLRASHRAEHLDDIADALGRPQR